MRRLAILAVLLAVRHADAQPLPRAEDKAAADALFEEGRQLLTDGKRAEACQKFDLSIRKDPRAVGTMLNLGLCREEVGLIATALRYYEEARDRARDQNLTEHQEAAERKIALLAPRVPHLAITLPANIAATARVLVDDIVFPRDALGDVTLDPGSHTLVVTQPGKLPYETKLELAEAERHTTIVPSLQGSTTVVVEASSRRALWGKLLVAGGGVMLVGGVGVVLLGRSQYWGEFPSRSRDGVAVMDASHDCWTSINGSRVVRECNTRGRDATASARRLTQIGVATAIAGSAIAIGGAVLWLTAPQAEAAQALSLDIGPGHAGILARGSF